MLKYEKLIIRYYSFINIHNIFNFPKKKNPKRGQNNLNYF